MRQLIEYLKDIEYVTDINGCFFINVEDNTIIESTVPFQIPKEILWELSVLRDTFQQFASGINHGGLDELMMEGEKGYMLLYNIPPHLILLCMASDEISLSYVKLAMIDIMKHIREDIKEMGEGVLTIPEKQLGLVGQSTKVIEPSAAAPIEVPASRPTPIRPAESKASVTEPKDIPIVEQKHAVQEEAELKPLEPEVEFVESEASKAATIPAEEVQQAAIHTEEKVGVEELISQISSKRGQSQYETLESAFIQLKNELSSITGVELSKLLENLKDAILENIGTSLALFDISRTAREVSKIQENIPSSTIKKYSEKIDNWIIRIVKK